MTSEVGDPMSSEEGHEQPQVKPSRQLGRWLRPKRVVALVPVLIGLVILAVVVQTKTGSPRRPAAEVAQAVRVVAAQSVEVVPRTIGYGRVGPALTWDGVSEVAGRIEETHDQLEVGAIVPGGSELARFDAVDYELAVEEVARSIEELEAQRDELDAQRSNDEALLQIEARSLALLDDDLARQRTLFADSAISRSELDEAERRALAQRTAVQRLRNAIRLVPAQERALEARIASQRARLAAARRDLARVRIVAPFDLRITAVLAQEGSYVAKGASVVRADAISRVEVVAQFQIDRVRRLLPAGRRLPLHTAADETSVSDLLDLSAVVRIQEGDFVVEWDARFDRIDASLDPRTRTVGFVVEVDAPYEKARTGARPPLMRGMLAEVELRSAQAREGIAVPRAALDGDHVWVVDDTDRMRRRQVRIEFLQGGFAVVGEGLVAGERVIVSDPVPAMDGVLVRPLPDEELAARIASEARGEERLR